MFKHRCPLGSLLLLLPMSIYGSSLSVTVQTNIQFGGPSCSMQAITSASCSSSIPMQAGATASATAAYGHLEGGTVAGSLPIYSPFVYFDTSYSEMLTITAPNHSRTGTLMSLFKLLASASTDSRGFSVIRFTIHQGNGGYDQFLSNASFPPKVVSSTFEFGVPFVFSADISQSFRGCCGEGQIGLGSLDLMSFTVLDGDNNTLTDAMITNDQFSTLSTPEPRTALLAAVTLLALVAIRRKVRQA